MRWPGRRRADDDGGDSDAPVDVVSSADDDAAAFDAGAEPNPTGGGRWTKVAGYALLPGVVVLLAAGAGYLKWQDAAVENGTAASDSVRAATDSTIALLTYKPDTVDKDLAAARSRMTGQFLDSYTSLTRDVVIPGAKQKQISAIATVPAAASVRANSHHAVVLLFVNQSIVIKQDAPTSSASTVRVTLDKVDGHWLISNFDPV